MSTLFIYSLFTRFSAIFCSHSSVFKLKLKNPRRENPSGQIILFSLFSFSFSIGEIISWTIQNPFENNLFSSSTFTWTLINIFFSSWNSQTLKAVSHFEAFWLHLLASILFGLAIWLTILSITLAKTVLHFIQFFASFNSFFNLKSPAMLASYTKITNSKSNSFYIANFVCFWERSRAKK